uniref:Zinc-finger domain-containing protein n=1 Tax=Eiseniibacteriota bacterium TaxID=2212470 RepID=A0A832I522_UNCEI
MKHPSWEELSAYLDHALDTHRWAVVARHLEDCQACRDDLAELEAEQRALERVVRRDPGDAYFDTFLAGVEARLDVDRGAKAPAGLTRGWARWWQSPRVLAAAGGVAALAVVAGVVLVSRPWERAPLRDATLAARGAQTAPGPAGPAATGEAGSPGSAADVAPLTANEAPAGGGTPAPGAAPAPADEADRAGSAAPAPAPARAYEVRRDEASGEAVRLQPPPAPGAPAAAKQEGASAPLSDLKRRAAQPLTSNEAASRALAPQPAPAPGAALEARASGAAAPGRLCGEVSDATGRALRFASVVLVRGGVSVQTDDGGRFCLGGPSGPDTLVVSLVGFRPARLAVRLGPDVPEVSVRLETVSPLERLSVGGASRPRAEAPPAAAGAFAALPESLRRIAESAGSLQRTAADTRQARAYDASAAEWERLLERVRGTSHELEVRRRLAEARFRAWELDPDARRAGAATEALTAYLTRAPAGAERNRAAEWLDRVRR